MNLFLLQGDVRIYWWCRLFSTEGGGECSVYISERWFWECRSGRVAEGGLFRGGKCGGVRSEKLNWALGGIVKEDPVEETHLRAHERKDNLVCRLLGEQQKESTHERVN